MKIIQENYNKSFVINFLHFMSNFNFYFVNSFTTSEENLVTVKNLLE